MTRSRFAAELLPREAQQKKRERLEMLRRLAAAGGAEAQSRLRNALRQERDSAARPFAESSRARPPSRVQRPAPLVPGGTACKAERGSDVTTSRTDRLEEAIAAATGRTRRPLDHAETIDARAIDALAEAFEIAAGRVADPVAILRVRLHATHDFLARIGDAHQPRAAGLMADLRSLRFDLGTLVNHLDDLLEAKERHAPVPPWPARDDGPAEKSPSA